MIHWYLLTWQQVTLLENTCSVLDNGNGSASRRTCCLLCKKTSSALWSSDNLASSSMKSTCCFSIAEDTSSHEMLDLFKGQMTKLAMPTKQFFLGWTEIVVVVINSSHTIVQWIGCWIKGWSWIVGNWNWQMRGWIKWSNYTGCAVRSTKTKMRLIDWYSFIRKVPE